MKKEIKEKIKAYNEKVKVELNAFEIRHIINLLEQELEGGKISTIECWFSLFEYLKEILKKEWKD